jgi:deazaflavin-dependent oxidoreductase (nitroreductase family)
MTTNAAIRGELDGEADEVVDWQEADRLIRQEIHEFGEVRNGYFAGKPVLLLTTTGAKSGEPRTAVVSCSRDGDALVVVGSKAGQPQHPAWYFNLNANPVATVETGGEVFEVAAEDAVGADRDALYDAHAAIHAGFLEYPALTDRVIPVVRLRPRS